MKTLTPIQFLRVTHKFFAWHVGLDKDLKSGPTLLYLYLFFICHERDYCWPSQATLATLCKVSERTLQAYISELVRREYIAVERQGTRNIYRLLCSPRVCRLLELARMEMLEEMKEAEGENSAPLRPEQAKISAGKGEKSSPELRVLIKQEINTPLSPLPQAVPSDPRPERRGCTSPFVENGRKEPTGSGLRRNIQDEFPKLWELWPRKQDRFGAYQEYARLVKSGLPPLDELLHVVKRLMVEDRSWQRGYVPNLKFWLRDRRWLDMPFGGQGSTPTDVGAPTPASPEEIQAREDAILRRVIEPDKRLFASPETRLRDETEARLCAMWPRVPRGMVAAGLCLARDNLRAIAARLSVPGQSLMPPPVPDPGAIACILREVAA